MFDQEGYAKSIELLHRACTPAGFVAAVTDQDNYRRIWTRDGVFTAVAALLTDITLLHDTARQTLITLFEHQHAKGFMPSNVSVDRQHVSYGGSAGRADTPCWAVAGLCLYARHTGDTVLTDRYFARVARCFELLDIWEFNAKHLVYVPQAGDWADEYIHHGYTLFVQLLRVWALEEAARCYHHEGWWQKAQQIRQVLAQNFSRQTAPEYLYTPALERQRIEASPDYWLMGFNPARIYPYFDLQANALALALDLGDGEQNQRLVSWLASLLREDELLPSFFPTITSEVPDMHELRQNFAFAFRNAPGQFHNGGCWPVWNGLMAAALAKAQHRDMASQLTRAIHAANQQADQQFNECLDGYTRQVCGVPFCTWSAAGALWAEHALDGQFAFA